MNAKKYRLGLDIGTNSLGWAMWSLGGEGPEEILDMGVRIFPDGRKSSGKEGPGLSLAVNRREARHMRRRRDRALQRKRVLVNELVRQGLWPDRAEERSGYSSWDPYELRAKALREQLKPAELGRILLHFAQRRGFKSNRIVDSGDKETTDFKERIANLKEDLKSSEFETLGEYLNSRKKIGARFRKDSGFYPDRKLYIDEFKRIQERQEEYFPELRWDKFCTILFTQRKLKPQEKGKCRFTGKKRARKCLPSTHRFRILQELANIRKVDSHRRKTSLSPEEFSLVFEKLERQKTLAFSKLRTLLEVGCEFNLEDEKRKKLLGNDTSCDLRKKDHFGDLWDAFDEKRQDDIVNKIVEAEEDSELRKYLLNEYELSSSQVDNIVKLTFPRGTARYSACFHRKCSRIMKDNRVGFAAALKALGLDHRLPEGGGGAGLLPYYGEVLTESCNPLGSKKNLKQNASEVKFGKIGNPTVHIAQNQLRRLVNSLIEKHGKPEEIVLEMSKELKHGREEVKSIIRQQAENQKNNKRLNKDLKENYRLPNPSLDDREKLGYYKELMYKSPAASCPYCGKVIKAGELLSENIQVEHILPILRTLDDGRNNKTIAHRRCNVSKGDRSPYEAFGHSPEGFSWQEICSRASHLPPRKRWRFDQDAMERFEGESDGFIQRQLTDNAYIAKAARRYLTSICPSNKVWGVAFRQTAELRRQWELDCILSKKENEKNRSDHRHHAVDAAVIGLIDRSMIQGIAKASSRNEGNLRRAGFKAPPFPGGGEGRRKVAAAVKSIVPSIKPDHGHEGRLYKETAYGKVRKALPLGNAELKEDMIPQIVPARVRKEFEDMKRKEGFKKARKALLENHPEVRVMQELWVTSKPITSIESSDLKEPTYGRNTRGPSDFALRRRLKEYIEEKLKLKLKLKEVLESYGEKFGVKHVRYIPENQKIEKIESSPGKGYEIADYAYVDIWKIPASKGKDSYKYEGKFVSRLEAMQMDQKGSALRKKHPKARRLMRLYKNDTIRVEGEKDCLIYRIAGFATTQNKIDIQPIYAGDEGWFEKTNPKSLDVSYPPPKKMSLKQCFKSVNSLWNENRRITRITVRCDGSFR